MLSGTKHLWTLEQRTGRKRLSEILRFAQNDNVRMNEQPSKIYLLPNLMTAGNLFCGFTATLKILEGALLQASNPDAAGDLFHTAIWCILGAFVFDFLDGRLARLGGHESSFGREFDSLADIVSFGLAPALMVYRVVRQEFPGLRCAAPAAIQFNGRKERGSESSKYFHRFSHSRRGRLDCIDHVVSALAGTGGTSPGQLALRFAAIVAFSLVPDVQPVSISQL